MALLDAGNTDFAASVERSGWHFRSRRLDRLLAALVDVQQHAGDRARLATLHKRTC